MVESASAIGGAERIGCLRDPAAALLTEVRDGQRGRYGSCGCTLGVEIIVMTEPAINTGIKPKTSQPLTSQPATSQPATRQPATRQETSEDRIRVRAYELYEKRNGAPGDAVSDWYRAEVELKGNAAERAK
jgi:hypothetical protein